jgi:serine/threonine protein kinase
VPRFRRIVKLSTQGGQAEVWRGEGDAGRAVAIKVLRTIAIDGSRDESLQRFKREIRCQMTMWHDNIVPILGSNLDDDPPWYAMPLASTSLALRLDSGAIAEDEAINIILAISEAIRYSHEQGVIHRDLKPDNVLFVDGAWMVSDFGMCRDMNSKSLTITRSNALVGSMAYVAPEQYDDAHEVGAPADVFALGKILYHCLTGLLPFPYTSLEKLPAKFRYLVNRCIAENPAARYQTVEEFIQELQLLSSASEVLKNPPEYAKDLAQQVLTGSGSSSSLLVRFLLDRSDDEVLYKEFVTYLAPPVLARMQLGDPAGFNAIVRQFDVYAQGHHPFSYTDNIATFLSHVFALSRDADIRSMCLERILLVGAQHNRYYVRDVFARLVKAANDAQDVLAIAGLLRRYPSEADFVAPVLREHSLPVAILQALPVAS